MVYVKVSIPILLFKTFIYAYDKPAKNIFIGVADNDTSAGVGYENTEGDKNIFIGHKLPDRLVSATN